jgi:hypothetical protein
MEDVALAVNSLAFVLQVEFTAMTKAIEHQAVANERLAEAIERAAMVVSEGMRNINANY